MSSVLSSSALSASVNSTLSSAHTLWMSADVVWALFLVLLALSMLVSLRFDWLRVWWLDQWRQLSGADTAEDPLSDAISIPRSISRSMPRPPQQLRAHSPRTGHPLTPAHRLDRPHTPLLTTAGTAQRPLFHRSGRRH